MAKRTALPLIDGSGPAAAGNQVVNPGTVIVPMIGQPIGQVITPAAMNQYFVARQINACVVPMEIDSENVADFFAVVRGWRNCAGVSVTMPHKQAAFTHSDEVTERARLAGAANLISKRADGRLLGDMTDGPAFCHAVENKGGSFDGSMFLLVGAGGAGSAAAHAAAAAGAAAIAIVETDDGRLGQLSNSLAEHYPALEIISGLPPQAHSIDMVFNATPLGMNAGDQWPVDLEICNSGTIVADAVTKPIMTPWLEAARSRGQVIVTGEEMALAQLPIQLPLWGLWDN